VVGLDYPNTSKAVVIEQAFDRAFAQRWVKRDFLKVVIMRDHVVEYIEIGTRSEMEFSGAH